MHFVTLDIVLKYYPLILIQIKEYPSRLNTQGSFDLAYDNSHLVQCYIKTKDITCISVHVYCIDNVLGKRMCLALYLHSIPDIFRN